MPIHSYSYKERGSRGNGDFSWHYKEDFKKSDKVYLSGFGTFSVVKRKARKGRNPKTGEAVKIAAKFMPRFKPARAFKEAVQ
jgi:DNA-binding protein HU-beta